MATKNATSAAGKTTGKGTGTRTSTGTAKKSAAASKTSSRGKAGSSTGKKTTGRSGASGKSGNRSYQSTSAKRVSREEEEDRSEYILEIGVLIFVVLCIFILISGYVTCGKYGSVISWFFFGLFGSVQYVFPIYVAAAALFIVANGPKKWIIRRVVWIGVIFMIAGFICQLIQGAGEATVKSLYFDGYRSKLGGGIVFGGILSLVYKFIGKVGAVLLIILLTIISIIQVTNVSFIAGIQRIIHFDYRGALEAISEKSSVWRKREDDYYDDDEEDDEEDDEYYVRRSPKKTSGKPKKEKRYEEERKNYLKASTIIVDDEAEEDLEDEELDEGSLLKEGLKEKKSSERGSGKKKKKETRDPKKNQVVLDEEVHELRPIPDPYKQDGDEYMSFAHSGGVKLPVERSVSLEARAEEQKKQASAGVYEKVGYEPESDEEEDEIEALFRDKSIDWSEEEKTVSPAVPASVTQGAKKTEAAHYVSNTEEASRRLTSTLQDKRGFSVREEERTFDEEIFDIEKADFVQGSGEVQVDTSEEVDPREAMRTLRKTVASDGKAGEQSASPKNTVVSDGKEKASEKTSGELAEGGSEDLGAKITAAAEEEKPRQYPFPPISLLDPPKSFGGTNEVKVKETAIKLRDTLETFGVKVKITNYSCGPSVTRYEMQPEIGVKVSKILSLQDDIKLNLAAEDIRIEAPIPGKAAIGIEIPNQDKQMVSFRELIDTDVFNRSKSLLSFAAGKDISGQIIIGDIAKMPHVLIAGQTGSGKSVCINTIIMSILYKAGPEDVRMIMIDPKMVELSIYNGIPHLLIPVVTDPMKAAGALNWAVEEMTRRYQDFQRYNVRNIQGFNQKVEEAKNRQEENPDPRFRHMTQLVVIVDELADLMMTAHGEVEGAIVRLTQLARAAGIHLVIATQRPSVDVITGLIKANVPSRIAFSVASGVDSRTVLDQTGAEKLLGKGDMLFFPTGYTKPVRVQGAFLKDEEVERVTDYIRDNWGTASYDSTVSDSIDHAAGSGGNTGAAGGGAGDDGGERFDELFEDAARLVIDKDKASIGNLQRVFRIGFNRAARIMDQLEEFGVVGPEEGTKPRRVLMTMDQLEEQMSL